MGLKRRLKASLCQFQETDLARCCSQDRQVHSTLCPNRLQVWLWWWCHKNYIPTYNDTLRRLWRTVGVIWISMPGANLISFLGVLWHWRVDPKLCIHALSAWFPVKSSPISFRAFPFALHRTCERYGRRVKGWTLEKGKPISGSMAYAVFKYCLLIFCSCTYPNLLLWI